MPRKSNILIALDSYSADDIERLIKAKRLSEERARHAERLQELTSEARRTSRIIRKLDRAIAKALKSRKARGGKKHVKAATAKPRVAKRKGRRGGRKGRLLGLRPNSLASKITEHLKKASDQRASVASIVEALKGWKGRNPNKLASQVAATLYKRKDYFKRVKRGVYTVAGA